MLDFVRFLRQCWLSLRAVLDSYFFEINGLEVSIFDILIGLLAMAIIIAVFWKGARA